MRPREVFAFVAVWCGALAIEAMMLPTGLWRDEATSVFESSSPHLADVVARVRISEINPPLFYLLLHAWIRVAGTGALAMKLLPLACSAAVLALTYAIARRAGGATAALVALAFVGANATTAVYATELRPYATATLCALGGVYALVRWRERPGLGWLAVAGLANVAFAYASYIGALSLAALAAVAFGLARSRRELWQILIIAVGLPGLLSLPLLGLERAQASSGLISYAFPWSYRPIVFLIRAAQALPFSLGTGHERLVDAAGAAVAIVLGWFLLRALRSGPAEAAEPARAVLLLTGGTFVVVAAAEAALSLLVERYIAPVLPLGTIAVALVVASGARRLAAAPALRSWGPLAGRVALVAVAVLPMFVEARALAATARLPKSAMAAVARTFPLRAMPGVAIVVAPDWAAQTLVYEEGSTAGICGFVRWERPDLFDLRGYRALWNDPGAVGAGLSHVAGLLRGGTRELVVLRMAPLVPQFDPDFVTVDAFVSALRERYRLARTLSFPASRESATAYVFTAPRSR